MECLRLRHTLAIEAHHVEQAAYVALHTICFHRLVGTVRPAYIASFDSAFPAVADGKIDALLLARAAEASALASTHAVEAVELVVLFEPPLSSRAALDSQPEATTSGTASGESDLRRVGGVVTTATQAASSLRAWASPRSYPWLAHALSGGAGQPSAAFVAPPVEQGVAAQLRQLEHTAFESWTLVFTPQRRGNAQSELQRFVHSLFVHVQQSNPQLPPIASADLCPYPMHILVRPTHAPE